MLELSVSTGIWVPSAQPEEAIIQMNSLAKWCVQKGKASLPIWVREAGVEIATMQVRGDSITFNVKAQGGKE